MKKRKKIYLILCAILYVAVSLNVTSACALSYFGYNQLGGTWLDAEKSPNNSEDDDMCWAAAASNILAWTGWGYVQNQSFMNEDDIFGYFQDYWTDNGGLMEFGWNWWFDGTHQSPTGLEWSYIDVSGGGDFWDPPYNFANYYYRTYLDPFALPAIDQYLHNGYGVSLGIYGPGGHAITCWGYEFSETSPTDYLGIYITDSDDDKSLNNPPDTLDYYEVSFNTSNNRWYLQNYGGSSAWYVGEVQALAPKPGYSSDPVPEPATMLLLGSGLIGLASFARKKVIGKNNGKGGL